MCNCNKSGSAAKTQIRTPASSFSASSSFSVAPPKRKAETKGARIIKSIQPSGQEIIETISEGTLAEKCQTFAYVLGLENPVPENILIAAIENPNYAKRLFMHRNDSYLYELLNNPPEKQSGFSTSTLISKAGKALLHWGLSGFPTVSKATLEKREDACLACPNLIESSSRLQKISASATITNEIGQRTGNKSCAICGCVIRNKVRLETETCPEEMSDGLNRWGEEMAIQ